MGGTTHSLENIDELGIDNIAEILNKSVRTIATKAKSLGFDVSYRPKNHDWYLRNPFRTTEKFVTGWEIVYGRVPTCADCKAQLGVGEYVQWVGDGDEKRLVCLKCSKGKVEKVG